jgi:sulfite reductase (NADPH) hemoprotein beta-component
MAAVDDPKTLGRARLSFASVADIDEFVSTLERFERGEIGPDEWRVFRLVRGTYAQRQEGDVQMLRVKIPQGVLDGPQLRALAEVADAHSRGFGHITTRQNMQLHFMRLHDVEPAMRRLAAAGLTTREACGNSVRNITGCPYAGVAADEVFDVTPYAEALTRYLLRHPLASVLPRKFKIAFEGCAEDHAVTAINDIGWRARLRTNGHGPERGFRVTVGGGTALRCASGRLLFDFLLASDICAVAEAILRVYHARGDYKHRQRNRLKYLIDEMGWEAWREAFDQALAAVRAEGVPPLPFDPERPPVEDLPDWPQTLPPTATSVAARAAAARVRGPGIVPEVRLALPVVDGTFARWATTNVRPQKQAGYALVSVTVPLGDVTAAQMRLLADLAEAYGDGTVRTSHDQNLVMRWVRSAALPELYKRIAAAGLGLDGAGTLADVTSCPGAESCRLAITQSRGLGKLLGDHLREHPELVSIARELDIKISGCPNGCGQHHIAGIGFQGSVRRLGGKVIPQYFVTVGGGVDGEGASFGRLVGKIPARRLTETVERLLALYAAERTPGEPARAFFRRLEPLRARAALADLERLSEEDVVPADFVDLGDQEEMKLETLAGECSA